MTTIRIATGTSTSTSRTARRVETEALWAERGLAVARSFEQPGWTITHLASGFAILQGIRTHRDAITVARRLLDAGDWTRSKTAVLGDRQLKGRARDIVAEARLLGLVKA